MKNEHLIGELEHLGIFLTEFEIKNIQKAVKRDLKRNDKRKARKQREKMVSSHESRINY